MNWRLQLGAVPVDGTPVVGPDGDVYVTAGQQEMGSASVLYAIRPNGTLKWKFQPGNRITSDPTLDSHGRVFIHVEGEGIYALTAAKGAIRWHGSGGIDEGNIIVDAQGIVYYGSEDDGLVALNPDGSFRWNLRTGSPVLSTAVAPNGDILISCLNQTIIAATPEGIRRWETRINGVAALAGSAVGDGMIVVLSNTGFLQAIGYDGRPMWETRITGRSTGRPTLFGRAIYIVSDQGELLAVSLAGTHATRVPTPGVVTDGSIAVANDMLIVACEGKTLHALYPDGRRAWAFEGNRAFASPPGVGSDGKIYIGTHDGYLQALRPDGSPQWAFQGTTGTSITNAPAVTADGRIVCISSDSCLHWVRPTGEKEHVIRLGDRSGYGPSIGPDGTIYVVSYDGTLYAIGSQGTMHWMHQTGDSITTFPIVTTTGNVVFAAEHGTVYSITPAGLRAWTFQLDSSSSDPMESMDGRLFLASSAGTLYCLRPDGTAWWTSDSKGERFHQLAMAPNGTILARSTRGVFAFDTEGTRLWVYQAVAGDLILAGPVVFRSNTAYVGCISGVYAIGSSGEMQWKFNVPLERVSGVTSLMIDTDGVILAGTSATLYAISPTGEQMWKIRLRNLLYAGPIISAEGTVYIGSDDGMLYAIGDRKQRPSKL